MKATLTRMVIADALIYDTPNAIPEGSVVEVLDNASGEFTQFVLLSVPEPIHCFIDGRVLAVDWMVFEDSVTLGQSAPSDSDAPTSARVQIETGISEQEQETNFMNATLQAVDGCFDGTLAMSISVIVSVPSEVSAQGEDAVAAYLRSLFSVLPGNVTVEIQIGEATK